MKKTLSISLLGLLLACSEPSPDPKSAAFVETIVSDINSLEEVEKGNPIEHFIEAGKDAAARSESFDKSSVESLLKLTKDYATTFISVGNHTLVQIVDADDCSPSGSWGACMPKGKGYIKKGELELKEDYINNIIGLPDDQERTIYFFNAQP